MATTDTAVSTPRFIEELAVSGYGCITDATFKLSRLHAFVGPNDSGKSTLLRAIQLIVSEGARGDARSHLSGKMHIAIRLNGQSMWFDARQVGGTFGRAVSIGAVSRDLSPNHTLRGQLEGLVSIDSDGSVRGALADAKALIDWIASPLLLRLAPDALRVPSALIPKAAPIRFADEKGAMLPGLLDAIRDRDEPVWVDLRGRFLDMFPLVKQLHLAASGPGTKSVEVELHDGTRVPAELMSEGMLYYLAFLAAAHADRAGVILVEEPENGLHPARVAEVMAVLREVSKTQQVILATHSPLVLNELEGDEITVLVRTKERGTQGTRLCDTPSYAERAKVYANGELWVSYANGMDEAPLLEGTARP